MTNDIPIGSFWKHLDVGGICTVWEVCEEKDWDSSSSTTFYDQDIYLRLIWSNDLREGTVQIGWVINYWSVEMLTENRWSEVRQDDIPMIILSET